MPKKPKLPTSPLAKEDWPLSPEEELDLYVDMERERFLKDPSHALPAFNALGYIAAKLWSPDGPTGDEFVRMPVWVLETLAEGFFRYRDAAKDGTAKTLGEAYCIEGGGQGKEPKILKDLRVLRDIRLATAIAIRNSQGEKIEALIHEMAERNGLSVGQVRRIWQSRRERAKSAVSNFRKRRSS